MLSLSIRCACVWRDVCCYCWFCYGFSQWGEIIMQGQLKQRCGTGTTSRYLGSISNWLMHHVPLNDLSTQSRRNNLSPKVDWCTPPMVDIHLQKKYKKITPTQKKTILSDIDPRTLAIGYWEVLQQPILQYYNGFCFFVGTLCPNNI